MKKTIFLAGALVVGWLSVAAAEVWVDPSTRKEGTHVQGHYRSNPDGNDYRNWPDPRNANPYSGKPATGDQNRYVGQDQNRGDQSYDTHRDRYYQFQYRW